MTQYWIYILNQELYASFDHFIKIKSQIITFKDPVDISEGDIGIIYVRNRQKSGIIKYFRFKHNCKKNSKYKIFKNPDYNNYYIEISNGKEFESPVKTKDIFPHIKYDIPGHKSSKNFYSKYISHHNFFVKELEYGGENLLKYFLTLKTFKNSPNSSDSSNNSDNSDSSDSSYSSDSSDSSDSSYSSNNSDNSDSSYDYSYYSCYSYYSEESDDSANSTSSNNSASLNNSNDSDDSDCPWQIPIMIIPCDFLSNYILNTAPSMSYSNISENLAKHYKMCDECEITNNNNRELCSIIDVSKIETRIIDKYIFELDEIIDYYLGGEKYFSSRKDCSNYVRFNLIGSFHPVYDNCIIVEWFCKNRKKL